MIAFLTQEVTRTIKTSFLFAPLGSFNLDQEPYVSLSTDEYSDFISYVFCNKGLGNRTPSRLSFQNGNCLACAAENHEYKLNEPHILLECPRYSQARQHLDMHHAVNNAMYQAPNVNAAYAVYWGKQNPHPLSELKSRIRMANQLVEVYENDTRMILDLMRGTYIFYVYYDTIYIMSIK